MCERISFVKGLGLSSRSSVTILKDDFRVLLEKSKKDSKFIILEGIYMYVCSAFCVFVCACRSFFVAGEHCYVVEND